MVEMDSEETGKWPAHGLTLRGVRNSLSAPGLMEQLPHWAFLLLLMGQDGIQLKGSFSVLGVRGFFVRARECGPRI